MPAASIKWQDQRNPRLLVSLFYLLLVSCGDAEISFGIQRGKKGWEDVPFYDLMQLNKDDTVISVARFHKYK